MADSQDLLTENGFQELFFGGIENRPFRVIWFQYNREQFG
jgi:hypothetical protein